MKDKNLSHHIWCSIEAQAHAVVLGLNGHIHRDCDVEVVNEIELERLRVLISRLEGGSPE